MILQYDPTKKVYYHVPLADLTRNGTAVRSFSTSKQLIEWVIQQFNNGGGQYVEYKVVANGPIGPQVSGANTNYSFPGSPNFTYTPGSDADVLVDSNIIYDTVYGLRTSSSGGAGGWG
ncbi:MAG TPA: hypothetical protein VMH87_18725 [Pseudomonadales bacterium]|nr:hypothetical protein [Pseudomonadales bacterium]